jgi:hypothetical protein
MYSRHEESTALLRATAAQVFSFLDDHERLSGHMSKRSLMMGGGRMTTTLDVARGRAVGSIIEVKGRVFGLFLWLREAVIERQPPTRKAWETIGEPHLLVIGRYRLGFNIVADPQVQLTVWIDYDRPSRGVSKLLGRLFGRAYARWCVRRMLGDASMAFGTSGKALHVSGFA